MSEKEIGTPSSGGEGDASSKSTGGDFEGKQEDKVAYSTYKKAISELNNNRAARKELEQQLNEYRAREEQVEKEKLEQQGEYKKLLDLERKKNEEFLRERDEYKNSLITAHKLNAFKEKLPGRLASNEYYAFVDVNDIAIDPETNAIDESSVEATVNNFLTRHSRLVESTGKKLPNDAPQSRSPLSYEEWKRLPLKEKKERYNEVFEK